MQCEFGSLFFVSGRLGCASTVHSKRREFYNHALFVFGPWRTCFPAVELYVLSLRSVLLFISHLVQTKEKRKRVVAASRFDTIPLARIAFNDGTDYHYH